MKMNNTILNGGRGKLSSMVGSYWRGTSVLRQRVTPHNPQSEKQMEARSYMAQAVQNIRTTWDADPGCKEMWQAWASAYTFPNRPGPMPAWQSCLKVSLALNQFGLYADLGLLPTTAPAQVPDGLVTVTAVDNLLKVAWSDPSGTPATNHELQLWICQLPSPSAGAKPEQGRLVSIESIAAVSSAAHTFYTWDGGSFGGSAYFCVWGRLMADTDAVPGAWYPYGTYQLVFP